MKNKKLNETNNIKLILSNKKLLIRKIVKKGKFFDYHSLSRAKAREPDLGGLSSFTAKVENQASEEGGLWYGTCSIPLVRLNQWN